MTRYMKVTSLVGLFFTCSFCAFSQKKELTFKPWDGAVVAGYVDKGAFINFTGPGVKWTKKPYALLAGVLPSLKIKEDNAVIKNATVVPSLGAGFTLTVKHLAVQLPFYYTPKNASVSGKWHAGFGVGYKF